MAAAPKPGSHACAARLASWSARCMVAERPAGDASAASGGGPSGPSPARAAPEANAPDRLRG
jgi:hypothetical protein